MSYDYSKNVATSNRLIARFGRDITHQSVSNSSYDTSTSSSTVTTSNTTVKACDFDFTEKYNGNKYFDADSIQTNDRYALIAPTLATIDVADKLIIDSVIWNVINVKRLAPAGTTVLWIAHIRK